MQSIHSSCGHCSKETLVRALRRKGAKPLILRLARDFVCPSCQEIQINVLTQSQVWKPFLPNGKAFRLIKQNGVIPQTTSNTSFLLSLMKVAKMPFPMRDADLHRNPIWTAPHHGTSIRNSGCAILENQREYGSTAKVPGCQKLQQCSSARKVFC